MNYRFLLVRFQVEQVLNNSENIGWALKSLPITVTGAYGQIMDRIEKSQKKQIALKILSWVLLSGRVLKMRELLEALSVKDGEKQLSTDFLVPDKVVEYCESLVTYDKKTQIVRLTHYTLDDFLRKERSSVLLSSVDLAKTCLTYLGFDEFENPCLNEPLLEKRLENHNFSVYAVDFWGLHARGPGEEHP